MPLAHASGYDVHVPVKSAARSFCSGKLRLDCYSMLILIAHGSREPRWLASVEELTRELQAEHGQDRVRLAYMQCASPTLTEAVSDAALSGQTKIRVLPLFLTLGGHVARDIQNLVDKVRQAHPNLEVQLLPPVGKHPLFMELLHKIVGEEWQAEGRP